MIRVRFATGLVVEYERGRHVEATQSGRLIYDKRDEATRQWLATVPLNVDCVIESGDEENPIKYYHTGTYPERVLAHLEGKG